MADDSRGIKFTRDATGPGRVYVRNKPSGVLKQYRGYGSHPTGRMYKSDHPIAAHPFSMRLYTQRVSSRIDRANEARKALGIYGPQDRQPRSRIGDYARGTGGRKK